MDEPEHQTQAHPANGWRVPWWPALVATILLVAVVVGLQHTLSAAVLRGGLVVALIPCALIDLERRIIPNRITGPAAAVALLAGLALDAAGEPARLLAGAIAGGFLLLPALVRPTGVGMGDVKLLGVMGLFLGRAVAVAVFTALLASVLTGAVIARRRGWPAARKTALPFGPFLAAGGVLAAVLGDPAIHAYLHLHR